MFNSLKLTGACYASIFKISTAIRGTELSNNKILAQCTPEERIRNSLFNEFLQISNKSSCEKKTLKHESPFQKYYEDKINSFKISVDEVSTNFTSNEFYCPKLFDLLVKQLYLLPIWTGIIINSYKFSYSIKTRLSNNPVENWIGQMKNNILKDDIVISLIIIKFFLNSKFIFVLKMYLRVCQVRLQASFTKIFKQNILNMRALVTKIKKLRKFQTIKWKKKVGAEEIKEKEQMKVIIITTMIF